MVAAHLDVSLLLLHRVRVLVAVGAAMSAVSFLRASSLGMATSVAVVVVVGLQVVVVVLRAH